jgi:hypothetical protein
MWPKRKSIKDQRSILDTVRKPTAPPTRTFGNEKPGEMDRPAARKVKHKKKLDPVE